MAVLPLTVTVTGGDVYSGVPLAVLLSYRLNVTVSPLPGLTRPVTVAVSLIDWPTEAAAGVWLVVILGILMGDAADCRIVVEINCRAGRCNSRNLHRLGVSRRGGVERLHT